MTLRVSHHDEAAQLSARWLGVCMTDPEDVIDDLFRRSKELPRGRHVERLDQGTYHLDYHDSDRVYLLTVRQVLRVRLPFERPYVVGEVDGVRAQLVQVAVANHVEVALDAEQGPARQAALANYVACFEEWAQRGDREGWPPRCPAERFAVLRPHVSDDIGTPYRFASGQAGGTGTEWEATWRFLPAPPVEARLLTLRFSSPGAPPIALDLPLPAAQP